jgi:GxxExxY protein
MIKNEYPESELTGKIIGCAMEVHRIPGNGFQHVIYQRALAIEMMNQGIEFSREHEMEKGIKINRLVNVALIFLLKEELWLS